MLLSYVVFHLLFIVPPIVLLAVTKPRLTRTRATGIALLAAIAFVYTTPWDNYLIARGVWSYPPSAIVGRVGYAPYEEYAFFVLQPILTGLWFNRVVDGVDPSSPAESRRPRALGVGVWLALTVAGAALLTTTSGFYLGAILAWGAPVLAFQWAFGGHVLWRDRRVLAVAVGVPTLYLWVADAVAIAEGTWVISSTYTTGLLLVNLPVEEATFFLVTNLLVVQGLALYDWVLGRVAERPTDHDATDLLIRRVARQR